VLKAYQAFVDTPIQQGVQLDTYVAPWGSNINNDLPIINYSTGSEREWRRVQHVLVPDVQPGDVLSYTFSTSTTNPYGYSVELSGGLVLTPDPTGTAGLENMSSVSNADQPSNGLFMSRVPGYNISPQTDPSGSVWHGMHHGKWTISGSYIVPQGVIGDRYAAACFYAGGSSYTQSGEIFVIEPYTTDMSITRTRHA